MRIKQEFEAYRSIADVYKFWSEVDGRANFTTSLQAEILAPIEYFIVRVLLGTPAEELITKLE